MQEQNENGCHFDAARRGTGTASDEHQDNGKQFATLCERPISSVLKPAVLGVITLKKRTADDACRAHIGVKIISFQQIKQ